MRELSNLLRQRLGAQNSAESNGAGVHPDADTLTAFSEQLLPPGERQQLLKHLSVCGECREVLALSQVELPELATQPVLKPASVSFWRRLFNPAFGVAGLVAGIALVAVLVLQIPHKSGEQRANQESRVTPSSDQKTQPEPKPAAPAPGSTERAGSARSGAEAQPEVAQSFTGQQEADALSKDRDNKRPGSADVAGLAAMAKNSALPNKIASTRQPAPAQIQPVLTAGLKKQDFVNNAFFETSNADVVLDGNQYPSAPKPQPSASETRFTVNAPAQMRNFSDIPPNAAGNKSSVALLTPPPPQDHFGLRLDKWVIKGAHSVFRPPSSAPAIRSDSLGNRSEEH